MHSYYAENEGLNLFQANQSIAISVKGANDGETKYDPRYVRMIAYYFEGDINGDTIRYDIPVHNCTEKEWA